MTDTSQAIQFAVDPLLPVWAIAGFAAVAVVPAIAGLAARRPGSLLRLAAGAALAAAMLNPSVLRERREELKQTVAVVVDRTASQDIGERRTQTQAALSKLRSGLARLPHVEVREIEVRDDPSGSRLFQALSDGISDLPPERVGGAILLTDGAVDDVPAEAASLGLRGPVHALVTGKEGERDRRIETTDTPRFGIVGREQPFKFKVVDTGSDQRVRVSVRRDGQPVTAFDALPGEALSVPVLLPHAGTNVVEIEAEAAPGEITLANNRVVLQAEGVRDKLRVLLVSGQPHPGARTWRNVLKADPNVDLVHFTILRPPDRQDPTPLNELSLIPFPVKDLFEDKIRQFDLIVFDRYANQGLLPDEYFANVAKHVRAGGAVLVTAGPEFPQNGVAASPLAAILPAAPSGQSVEAPFKPQLPADGDRHPVTRGLSEAGEWGEWLRFVPAVARGGSTVMTGPDGKPLLVLSREGQGRVALLLSDESWLWARGHDGGGPYADLLRRLGHWLMKEPELDEEALRGSGEHGRLAVERQSMSPSPSDTVAVSPSGARIPVEVAPVGPGLWRGAVEAPEQGLWRVESGGLSAMVAVGATNPSEYRDPVSTTRRLEGLAAATGGSARRLADAADTVRVPDVFESAEPAWTGPGRIGVRAGGDYLVRGVAVMPLFWGFVGLALLAGASLAAWLAEARRSGGRVGRAE